MKNAANKYFFVYNPQLRKFLDQKGNRWTYKGEHNISKRPYWAFERNDKLDELLKLYDNERISTT